MPIAFEATLSGSVANAEAMDTGTFTGDVADPADTLYTLTGTVSRAVQDSWKAPSLAYRFRVKLDGAWVPTEELVGPFRARESRDGFMASWEFGLRGRRWSIAQSVAAWTRKPVEVYVDHGLPGDVIEPVEPTYSGYVRTCDHDSVIGAPMLRVQCGDDAILYDRYEACEEIPPLADYTRGEIVRLLCAAAGISSVACPDGAVYRKPLQATNKRLLDLLRDFVEPEGWTMRFRADGTLEFRELALKAAPLPPDDVWTIDELVSLQGAPPTGSPSRWVVNGSGVILVDELGVETVRTVTKVEALAAPLVAVEKQDVTGAITPTGLAPIQEAVILVSKIEDEQVRRGSQVLEQTTREWALHNPRHAVLVTQTGGAGTAGGGYDFVSSYIDEGGNYVAWSQQRLVLVAERRQRNDFDAQSNPTESTIDTYRWRRRPQGVATVGSYPVVNVVGAYVYDDDTSHLERQEEYGLDERQVVTYTFGSHGAQEIERQDTYRFRSPRSAIDASNLSYYIRYDGQGQTSLVANWTLVETRKRVDVLTNDQAVKGEREALYAWTAPKKADGQYDWGDFRSNVDEEVFRFVGVEARQFNVLSEDQVEQVHYPEPGVRVARLFLGRLPTTRYLQSVWTRLAQQPVQAIVTDDTAAAWWGWEREAVVNEYVQDQAEALRLIERRRARRMAHTWEAVRRPCSIGVGDTVLISSPRDGLYDRMIVADVEPTFPGAGGQPLATYRLEQPL